jgi:hypothetical protein
MRAGHKYSIGGMDMTQGRSIGIPLSDILGMANRNACSAITLKREKIADNKT